MPPNPMKAALPEDVLLASDPMQELLSGPLPVPDRVEDNRLEAVLPEGNSPEPLSPSKEERVLDCLIGRSLTPEELSEQTGVETGELLRMLFRLEMTGRVSRGPGGQYSLG